jgi:hypothetical protein
MTTNELKIKNESDKISALNAIQKNRLLSLPSHNYGPFCLKILSDFVEYHNLPKGMLMPVPGLTNVEALSRIFDLILHSMGEEKRLEILKLLDEYVLGLPSEPRTKKSTILTP